MKLSKRNYLLLLIILSLLFASRETPAETFDVPKLPYAPQTYYCEYTLQPINIDGELSEHSWDATPWTNVFVDIEGSLRPNPLWSTHVKMLWDSTYFYIAARLIEPDLWATYDKRDMVIFHENDFEVFIDPDGDTHNYYEFEMNALNTVWDLLLTKPYRDGGNAVNGWDIAGLKSAVKLYGTLNNPADRDSMWTIELAFPWKALSECANRSAPPKSNDRWFVNFSRVEWQRDVVNGKYCKKVDEKTGKPLPEYNWVWSPQGLINMHYPERWGIVEFVYSRKANAVPSVTADDITRDSLFQFYYAERQFRLEHNRYSPASNLPVAARFNRVIWTGSDRMYEAILPRPYEPNSFWRIREDGRCYFDPLR